MRYASSNTPTVKVEPNTVYVGPLGTDDASGRSPNDPTTFAHANEIVKPGQTVLVLPGNYTVPIVTTKNGKPRSRITWKSGGTGAAKIAILPANVVVWENLADYVNIIGFDISGGRVGLASSGTYVSISSNLVHDVGWRCTSAGGAGIEVRGKGTVVVSNTVCKIGVFDPDCTYYAGVVATQGEVSLDSNDIKCCSGVDVIWR